MNKEEKLKVLKERIKKLGYSPEQAVYTLTVEDILHAIIRTIQHPENLSDETLYDLIHVGKKAIESVELLSPIEFAIRMEVK